MPSNRNPLTQLDLVRRRTSSTRSAPPSKHDPVVGCGVYSDGGLVPHSGGLAQARAMAAEVGGFVWLGLYEPTAEEFDVIAKEFDLHPLAVEDAVNAHQRPKLERYDEMLFLVLKTCRYVEHEELTATSEVIATGEVMIFTGADFVVTVRHGSHGELTDLRTRLETEHELLKHGPAAVMYSIADAVVDNYLDVANAVEVDLDEVEASVFAPGSRHQNVGRIYQLKRELMELKRSVVPLVQPMRVLSERPLRLVDEDIREYFRDVNDHLNRVRDNVGSLDELLTSILQASIARLSLTENEDMRKITSWAAIAAVPTAIAGIYGMNFDYMPELKWTFGYPLVILVIVTICTLLYRGFKRNGWL